jgi:hypothetical protein
MEQKNLKKQLLFKKNIIFVLLRPAGFPPGARRKIVQQKPSA